MPARKGALRKLLKRQKAISIANQKGTHTKMEWVKMKEFFNNTCCSCFSDYNGIEKDHIIPISRGGSNNIENIQPMCSKCNIEKGSNNCDDLRPILAKFLNKHLPLKYKLTNELLELKELVNQ